MTDRGIQSVPPQAAVRAPADIVRVTVTIPDVTRLTGISRSEVYRLLSMGTLRAVKAGVRTLVWWDSVEQHLASLPEATFRNFKSEPADQQAA